MCSFVCDFIALEIMESELAFHHDNFCKFHVPYACSNNACALETRRRFVTERRKKRMPKPKRSPHCLGKKYTVNQGCMSLSTYYLEEGRHFVRLHRRRRRRAYAPTSNTASHDNHEKINSWVSFSFLYGYGAPPELRYYYFRLFPIKLIKNN